MAPKEPDRWILDVSPADRVTDVAIRSLRSRLRAVQFYLPRAARKSGDTHKAVHQLRVWTRRAGAAMKLYADLLPHRRAAWMKEQLKRLRKAAGDARDLDVLVGRLEPGESHGEEKPWMERLRARRTAAHPAIVAIQEELERDHRFNRRVTKLLERVRLRGTSSNTQDTRRFGDWARAHLRRIAERFFEAAPAADADAEAWHKFRIEGKQLRYAMELLAAAFPPAFREKLYPQVEKLQDKLGDINDLVTAESHLHRQLEEAHDTDEEQELRQVIADDQARLTRQKREFLEWCTPKFLDKLWKRFDKLLGRPGAVATRAKRPGAPRPKASRKHSTRR